MSIGECFSRHCRGRGRGRVVVIEFILTPGILSHAKLHRLSDYDHDNDNESDNDNDNDGACV
jgi:hypothetical protein